MIALLGCVFDHQGYILMLTESTWTHVRSTVGLGPRSSNSHECTLVYSIYVFVFTLYENTTVLMVSIILVSAIIYSSRINRNVVAGRPTVEIWESISYICMYKYFFSHPIYFVLSSPFYFISLLVVTKIRGHIGSHFSPLPTTVPALHFYREDISAISCLVDPHRIVRTDGRRDQQLILLFIFVIFPQIQHPGESPTYIFHKDKT